MHQTRNKCQMCTKSLFIVTTAGMQPRLDILMLPQSFPTPSLYWAYIGLTWLIISSQKAMTAVLDHQMGKCRGRVSKRKHALQPMFLRKCLFITAVKQRLYRVFVCLACNNLLLRISFFFERNPMTHDTSPMIGWSFLPIWDFKASPHYHRRACSQYTLYLHRIVLRSVWLEVHVHQDMVYRCSVIC